MTLGLESLHQQPFGPFDGDPDDRAMPPQPPDQLAHADDIVADLGLVHQVPEPVEDTQLVVSVTPVDADKDSASASARCDVSGSGTGDVLS